MGGFAMEQIERKIRRDANRRPVPWWEKAILYACLAMVLWFVLSPVYEWARDKAVAQAESCQAVPPYARL